MGGGGGKVIMIFSKPGTSAKKSCIAFDRKKICGLGLIFQAAYIDTEGTFRPERVRTIADRFGMDPEAVLDNIIVGRAANSEHRKGILHEITAIQVCTHC